MRRLLCNQVSVALVGIVFQIIVSEYYHGADCQKLGPIKPVLERIVPQVTTSYKKLSSAFLKSLEETPAAEGDENGLRFKNALHGTVKVVDNLMDGVFAENSGNALENVDDPVVGSANGGTNNKAYGSKFVDRLWKTGKFVDNFVDGFFMDSESAGNQVDNVDDQVVGSAKGGGNSEGYGAKFVDRLRKTGKFVDGFFPNSKTAGNEVDNANDPVVGSAKGGDDDKAYGRKFVDRLRKTGKFVDSFMDGIFTDSDNSEGKAASDSGTDPVVGSAKDSPDNDNYGRKIADRIRKTGKFFNKFVDEFFTDSNSENSEKKADAENDPVVGSAKGASDYEDGGVKFEDSLRKSGKFVDSFINEIFDGLEGSDEIIENNGVDDPVVGSAQDSSNSSSSSSDSKNYRRSFEDTLRNTGKVLDTFWDSVFGDSENSADKKGPDPVVGSANPTTEDDPNKLTEQPEKDQCNKPTSYREEISNDIEDDAKQPVKNDSNSVTPTDGNEVTNSVDDTEQPTEDGPKYKIFSYFTNLPERNPNTIPQFFKNFNLNLPFQPKSPSGLIQERRTNGLKLFKPLV